MGYEVSAQLITDSESKLKTTKKKEKDGFWIFGKKKTRSGSSSKPFDNQARSAYPRYSSGSPFASFNKRKSASPRTSSSNRASLFKKYQQKSPRYSSSGLVGVLSTRKKPVRYSSSQPFTKKDKVVSPRYSAGSPYRQESLFSGLRSPDTSPRYSSGSPFKNKRQSVAPRYSSGSPFRSKDMAASPRYSAGSPYRQKSLFSGVLRPDTHPRYSSGHPFKNKQLSVAPRYSAGSPFRSKDIAVSPRYSVGSPFTRKDVSVSPRYSLGSPFTRKDVAVSPRYSIGSPFTKKDLKVSPRYSVGSPYDDISWDWIKPRYSVNKHRFDVDERRAKARIYPWEHTKYKGMSKKKLEWYVSLGNLISSGVTANFEGSNKLPVYDPQPAKAATAYTGDFKLKWIKQHEMHPSSNYARPNQDSELVRNSLRKWNVFWTRLNRNKVQPDAVTDKISKPKFDRKEAEIWNE